MGLIKNLVRLLVIGIFVLASSCSRPLLPEYQGIEKMEVGKIGMSETDVLAVVKYYNPNKFKMKLKRAEMDVFINNRFVGKSVLDSLIIIPRRDTFRLPVSMKLDVRQLFPNALDILMNTEADIRLDGKARIGRSGVFFTVPIHYEGKQKLNLFQ